MRTGFNPLPFVFVTFPTSPESPAHVVYEFERAFKEQMEKVATAINPDALAALRRQWPELLDATLLKTTREMCATVRAGFRNYRGQN